MAPPSTPFVESWLGSHLPGLREITIDEGGGPVSIVLTQDRIVGLAVAEWESLANASGSLAGTYVFNQVFNGVEFTRTDGGGGPSGPGTFDLELVGSLRKALGFASSSQTGSGGYHSGIAPLGQVVPLAANYSAPTRDHQVQLRVYRWGRVVSHRYNGAKLVRLEITLDSEEAQALLDGPLFSSRLQVHCSGPSDTYPALPDFKGVQDVDVYGFPRNPQRWGHRDEYTTVELFGTWRG